MKKSNKEVNPNKKLLRIIFLIIFIPLVVYYSIKIYNVYGRPNEAKPLSRMIGEVQYNELNDVFYETSRDYFIYISYTNYKDVEELENKLKKVIIDYNLQDNMYYLNITDLLQNETFYTQLNEDLKLSKKYAISEVPAIVYYKDGAVKSVISSHDGLLFDIKEFKNLLEQNEMNEEQ